MEKTIIKVPAGVRYISDWKEYDLRRFDFPHIVDKQITGCGFTEYCLTNTMDLILCSPRRVLLENKEGQHENEVFYFKNDLDGCSDGTAYDKDLSIIPKTSKKSTISEIRALIEQEGVSVDNRLEIKDKIRKKRAELFRYLSNRYLLGKPAKILVTYDSFRILKDLLGEAFHKFQVVVDEFQSVLVDSRFKSTTELEFLKQLGQVRRVCYVSATPMLDKYLDLIDEFKDLPFFAFDWESEDPFRVSKPVINVINCDSINKKARSVINSFRNGDFEKRLFRDSSGLLTEIVSNEAVFYVNSVKNICDIIRTSNLTPEECNILCANTEDNKKRIDKAFRDSCGKGCNSISTIPKKGEPHKMFTFCTRTVYLGADFYSTCASTYVFSDANVETLAVDITLDLPQILGRQRLDENPWKNYATIYIKSLSENNKLSREDFDKILKKKLEATERLLNIANKLDDINDKNMLATRYLYLAKLMNYREDYVAVDVHEGKALTPVFNRLVLLSEERAFEIQQIDYKDRLSVFNAISSQFNDGCECNIIKDDVVTLLSEFFSYVTFPSKLKMVCTKVPFLSDAESDLFLSSIPLTFRNFYEIFGPEVCKSLRYRKKDLEERYKALYGNQKINVEDSVRKLFIVGERYTLKEIKTKLSSLYKDSGVKGSVTAKTILKYCKVSRTIITEIKEGKKDKSEGYKIEGYI